MRKNLLLTALLLTAGVSGIGFNAYAAPEPQNQNQNVVSITGTVLDQNDEPIIGATVLPVGYESAATATDVDGHFRINVPEGTLVRVSYVGYQTEEVKASQNMYVYMTPTTEYLDEVVVVGFGTQRRVDLTGAVSTVDVPRVMEGRSVQDVTKALQGNVPGLTITSDDGSIWSDANVKIRGVGTLSNGQVSSPLIVVDGVAVDNLNFVNPDDIADISVLKDAASSSIYGARAAFGVLLITTKSANKEDKVSVRYSNNFAWSQATYLPTFANPVDEAYAVLEAYYRGSGNGNTEIGGMPYESVLPYLQKWQDQHHGKLYTDYRELRPYVSDSDIGDYRIFDDGTWYKYAQWDVKKLFFNSAAPSQKHNVSLEGQSGKTNYRLSFGYDSKQGLENFNPQKMNRYMANANISTEIASWLKAGAIVNFSQREYSDPNLIYNTYQYLWRWNSFVEAYGWIPDEEGNPRGMQNPLTDRLNAHIDHQTDRQTRLQAWVQATLFKDLTLRGEFNYDFRTSKQNDAYTPLTMWAWGNVALTPVTSPTQAASFARWNRWDSDRWTMNIYATYDKTFKQDHHLKVMIGSQAERYRYDYMQVLTRGLTDPSMAIPSLTDGGSTGYQVPSISLTHSAVAGFFGRINYDWKGIWLLELNGRYDGSSKFPGAHQWAFFPSGSAGYRFSEEKYFEPLRDWWSNAKLRASIGSIGNENIGSNVFISTISRAGNANWIGADGTLATYWNLPGVVSNNLTWERINTYDVGIDLGFMNNSLNFSFDWYRRDTKDMLAQGETLPSVFGASNALTNAGSLRTDGWELSVNWNHSFGDANIYATFMLADAKTKVTKISNPAGNIYQAIPGNTDRGRFYEGQYVGEIWGFEVDRYFTVDDFTWNTADGKWAVGASQTGYAPGVADQTTIGGSFKYGPGDVKFKDLNGDGKIDGGTMTISDHGDAKIIGNIMPRYEYSFRLGGSWKGIDLDMFFQGVGKRSVWNVSSNVVPFTQAAAGLFDWQTSYNKINYATDADGNRYVTGYEVDQSNKYPTPWITNFSYGIYNQMMGQGVNNFFASDRYLTNMAYLRFKTLTIGYTLPYEWTKYAYIQNARIYFSAENLCMLYNGAKKFGIDPEIFSGDSGQSASFGYGAFGRTYPMSKSFSFGIQVTF